MDPQRPKKSRLGTEPSTSRLPTSASNTTKRPVLGERNDSATSTSSISRRRQSESKRSSDRIRRDSRAGVHDSNTQPLAEQRRASAYSVKSSVKSVDRDLPLLTYAVIGNPSVGKTLFIRNALDLRRPPSTIATSKVALGGVFYRLQLYEIQCESINFVNGKILWPSLPGSSTSPEIDGVLCLYDVTDRESLTGLSEVLQALNATGTSTCLVTSKVDIPLPDHDVPASFREKVKSQFPNVLQDDASKEASDTAKRCLLRVLKETLASESWQAQLPARLLAASNAASHNFPPRTSSRNPSETSSSRSRSTSRHQSLHSKSREDLLKTLPTPPIVTSDNEHTSDFSSADEEDPPGQSASKAILRLDTTSTAPRNRNKHPQTPVSTTEGPGKKDTTSSGRGTPVVPATPESLFDSEMNRRGSHDSRIYRTFLNMDDESIHEDSDRTDEAATSMGGLQIEDDIDDGVHFKDLVNRLLRMPESKGDQKFQPSFLCLYRAFATPLALLMAIIEKFVKTEGSDLVPLIKAAELLRYLSVLGMWTTTYPGDFADPKVREMATTFVTTIEKTKAYSAAARQIWNNLQTLVADEDEEWAFSDQLKSVKGRTQTVSHKPSASIPSREQNARPRHARRSGEDNSDSDEAPTPSSPRHSGATSSASSLVKASQITSQTSDSLHNLESAREQAKRFRTIPHNPISKVQWHQFLSCSSEELATEITRIDWTMYSAIRPRDFVRYVTMPSSKRGQSGSIDYISMMTKHFNHLALFTSGMILLRDKPKHRAMMLEKFMDLAWKVRQKNNYHALGAIVASLTSEEIVRLTQTQELIPQEQHKQFLRLKILMGHQKSHAAYRMAWENSSTERIPFLPRIQEDLTKAASANATFVGRSKMINWNKFEVMGETIVNVQKSQDQPYNFPDRTARGQDISKLILETKVLEGDEDCADPKEELYERSKQVEPTIALNERRKFDWLRR